MFKKMRAIIALIIVLLFSTNDLSADWIRTYGGSNDENGFSVQQTTDSGYIITGWTTSYGAGNEDVYLIKTEVNGDTVWTKTYGGSGYDNGESVQQTTDGGYIIVGRTASYGAGGYDVWLIKTDSNGDTAWTKTYGGSNHDLGYSVQQTSDGGYIITGYTESYGAGFEDVYLIKTDSNGDTVWTKTYGGSGYDNGESVWQTTDGGYIITGRTTSYGAGGYDVWLIKTDSNGDTAWTKTYGGSNYDFGYSVQQTTDSGYIITGWTNSFGIGSEDVYIIKTDVNGDTLWTRTYGGSGYDNGESVWQNIDGGYIIACRTSSFGSGYYDIWLIKTDMNGDTAWTKTYGGSNGEYGFSVQQTSDRGYIIAGHIYVASSYDFGLIRIDSPENFNLILPANAAILSILRPQLIWQSTVDNIKNYEVYIDDTLKITTNDTFWTVDYDLGEDVHSWFIIAIDSFELTTSSDTFSFEVDTTTPITPVLIEPVGGIFQSDTIVSFLWSKVVKIIDLSENKYPILDIKSSEIRYIIEIDTLISFNTATVDTIVDSFTVQIINEGYYYYWHVKAYDLAGHESPFSGVDSFGVDITYPVIESTTVIPDTTTIGPLTIDVKITDNVGLDSLFLYYQRTTDPNWQEVELSSTGSSWFSGIIPQTLVQDTVKYYIYARDIAQPANESTDPVGAPSNYYSFIVNALGVEEGLSTIPLVFSLSYNSPVSEKVIFRLAIPELSNVQLKIYDMTGRLVSIPVNGELIPSFYEIPFNPEAKGMYFYTIESENFNERGKFIIVE